MKRKALSIFLTIAMILAMMPSYVFADGSKINGEVEMLGGPDETPPTLVTYYEPDYNTEGSPELGLKGMKQGKRNTNLCTTITSGSSDRTVLGEEGQTKWYIFSGGSEETPIEFSKGIEVKGDVHIILENKCHYSVKAEDYKAGIAVNGSSSITIYAQSEGDEKGVLNVTAGKKAAGIGSDKNALNGTITINGGKITAESPTRGAAIGSGDYEYTQAANSGEKIIINGGEVTATGKDDNCGIGGYYYCNKGIIINDGKVTATATADSDNKKGCGIGITTRNNMYPGAVKDIYINGGEVAASGAIGIGGLDFCSVDNIIITGGKITSTGDSGCGIGAAIESKVTNIFISGGNLKATASGNCAGIGGGWAGSVDGITISGGTIEATGGKGAACIGGGYQGTAKNILISGGNITATTTTSFNTAGIGGGSEGSISGLNITGGTIIARGARAIGAYQGTTVEKITVSKDLVIKNDNNNPPTTIVAANRGNDTDISSSFTGQYAIIEPPYACKIGDKKYDSVAEALEDSKTNTESASQYTKIELGKDIEENHIVIESGRFIELDLKGHVLECAEEKTCIINEGNLKITNSDKEEIHYFKYKKDEAWKYYDDENTPEDAASDYTKIIDDTEYVIVKGGIITGGVGETINGVEDEKVGGAITNKGALSISDVSIVGNGKKDTTSKGGGIYNGKDASMTLKDVKILGNYAKNGAGVFGKAGSTDSMENAIIAYNMAGRYGGGLSTSAASTLKDVTVTKNTILSGTMCGAGLDFWGGSLTLKGKIIIYDNLTNGSQDNLFMEFNKVAGDGYNANIPFTLDGITSDSKIGVWNHISPMGGASVKIANENNTDYSNQVLSDINGCEVVYKEDGKIKDLRLKQSVFCVSSSGNDSTGIGTEEKPYKTIGKAATQANGVGTVKLLSNITLDKDYTNETTVPDTIIFNLNGHTILNTSGYKLKSTSGKNITFLVSSSADLEHAAEISQQNDSDNTYILKLTKDIDIESVKTFNMESGNYKKIIIDGQGHVINAANSNAVSEKQVFYFRNRTAASKEIEIKDLTINVKDGFRNGITFDRLDNTRPALKVTLQNLTINMQQTKAPVKTGDEEVLGAPVICNSADIIVKDVLSITTNKYSWAAIDLDNTNGNASLELSDKTAFTDNRTNENKLKEPLIGFSNEGDGTLTVTGADFIKIFESQCGTKKGYDFTRFDNGFDNHFCKKSDYTEGTSYEFSSKSYKFGGWYTGAAGTGTKLTGDASASCYYAKWIKVKNTEDYIVIKKDNPMPDKSGKYILEEDIVLDEDWNVPENTIIDLNGHSITGDKKIKHGKNLTLIIYNETDLTNANNIMEAGGSDFECNWLIGDSFTVTKRTISAKAYKKLVIDGNGKTITATQNSSLLSHVFKFELDSDSSPKNVEIKNLTLEVGDGFRHGFCFETQNSKRLTATLNNVTVKMIHTQAPTDGGKQKSCISVINNYSDLTIKGTFTAVLNSYSLMAINMDADKAAASLVMDDAAALSITDNRTDANKIAEPVIKIDNSDKNTVTITSKDITDNMIAVKTAAETPVLIGYSYKATAEFESNGGSSVADKTVAKYTKLVKPDDPTRDYYTFEAWYKDEELTTKWDFDKDYISTDITLYANWTGEDYNIEYVLNDGSFIKDYNAPSTYTYGVGETLPVSTNLEYEGYRFVGWYDNEGLNGTPVTSISKTANGDKKYYAKWVEKSLIPDCIYSADIKEGDNLLLQLGGKEIENVNIRKVSGGYQLIDKDGKYIAVNSNKVSRTESAYTWKYDGGLYYEISTTKNTFWLYRFIHGSKTSTTKYYLASDENGLELITSKVSAAVKVTDTEHSWVYENTGDDNHQAKCSKCGYTCDKEKHSFGEDTHKCVCGAVESGFSKISSVSVTSKTVTKRTGWWIFGRSTTVNQYTITVKAEGTNVSAIHYSLDEKKSWTKASSFTSSSKVTDFYIKVTDGDGNVTFWHYADNKVVAED